MCCIIFICFFLVGCLLVSCVSDKSHYIILLSHCLLFYVILCRLLLLNMLPYGTEWKTYARNRSHLRKHAVSSLTDWLLAWLVYVCVCLCVLFFSHSIHLRTLIGSKTESSLTLSPSVRECICVIGISHFAFGTIDTGINQRIPTDVIRIRFCYHMNK